MVTEIYEDPGRDTIYTVYCNICDEVTVEMTKEDAINRCWKHGHKGHGFDEKKDKGMTYKEDVRVFKYVRDLEEKEYYE
ncbi:MAG TPA: hypothetical protein VFX18_01945 [Candidatus Nitrosocosmicus sp.]|nr:hypothetical protein [Candidatus Nitrosocosmicus sp.]